MLGEHHLCGEGQEAVDPQSPWPRTDTEHNIHYAKSMMGPLAGVAGKFFASAIVPSAFASIVFITDILSVPLQRFQLLR